MASGLWIPKTSTRIRIIYADVYQAPGRWERYDVPGTVVQQLELLCAVRTRNTHLRGTSKLAVSSYVGSGGQCVAYHIWCVVPGTPRDHGPGARSDL